MGSIDLTESFNFVRFPDHDDRLIKQLEAEPGETYKPGDDVFVKLRHDMYKATPCTSQQSPMFSVVRVFVTPRSTQHDFPGLLSDISLRLKVSFINRSQKDTGAAVVLQPMCTDESDPYHGRVLVRFHDNGSTFHVRPARMTKVQDWRETIVITGETEHYRHLARTQLTANDFVVEIGSSYGVWYVHAWTNRVL